ncbi:MAG: hypothetical protein DRJ97_02655 [Thermoprotei archaeon]|nr:MAG: hypothetical protein DRJ97_02655 [Thermoprotei archaeon]
MAYSSIKVLRGLGFEVSAPEVTLCCGMPFEIAGLLDREGLERIAIHSLKAASKEGTMVTPCNGCYRALNLALRDEVKCLHVAEVLWRARDELKKAAGDALRGVKVAVHVGCHYAYAMRERALKGVEGEDILEDIALSMGADIVSYDEKKLCCGATAMKWPRIMEALNPITKLKVESLLNSGAEAVLVMCTACQLAIDRAQYQMKNLGELDKTIPVLHVSQLVGLALGLHPIDDLGLHLHLIRPERIAPSSPRELLSDQR